MGMAAELEMEVVLTGRKIPGVARPARVADELVHRDRIPLLNDDLLHVGVKGVVGLAAVRERVAHLQAVVHVPRVPDEDHLSPPGDGETAGARRSFQIPPLVYPGP